MCVGGNQVVRAELKSLHSPEADPLQDFRPSGPFGILVQAIVGPHGEKGQESFDFMLCSPEWFVADKLPSANSVVAARHYIFMREYDYSTLEKFVRDYCASCEGTTWREAAERVGRLGRWEFEDYGSFKSS
jgi:hypothetical protein